jgi:hypothetical protein
LLISEYIGQLILKNFYIFEFRNCDILLFIYVFLKMEENSFKKRAITIGIWSFNIIRTNLVREMRLF